MAFISSHRCSLASNLWPEDLGNLILRRNRLGSNIGVVSVPRTVEGMLSWASVERDPTHHERPDALCLVYQEALPNIQPISFHLYGFLHNFKLRPFGNWNGENDQAQFSEQSITLTNGGCVVSWANQLDRLNFMATCAGNICNLPLSTACFAGDLTMHRSIISEGDIYIGTSVGDSGIVVEGKATSEFPTVFGTATGTPLSIQPPLQWKEPLTILERSLNGTERKLHDLLLQNNDFVEVLANLVFKVVSFGTPDAALQVSIRFERVVRLGRQAKLL